MVDLTRFLLKNDSARDELLYTYLVDSIQTATQHRPTGSIYSLVG